MQRHLLGLIGLKLIAKQQKQPISVARNFSKVILNGLIVLYGGRNVTIKDIFYNALTLDQCKKLTTPRLLAYYKKHRWLQNAYVCQCCGDYHNEETRIKGLTASQYYGEVKNLLDKREHVC